MDKFPYGETPEKQIRERVANSELSGTWDLRAAASTSYSIPMDDHLLTVLDALKRRGRGGEMYKWAECNQEAPISPKHSAIVRAYDLRISILAALGIEEY